MKLKHQPFKYWIDVSIADAAIEVPCTVEFDAQPEEKPDREYPGCLAAITVTAIRLESGFNVFDSFTATSLENLEQLILESL